MRCEKNIYYPAFGMTQPQREFEAVDSVQSCFTVNDSTAVIIDSSSFENLPAAWTVADEGYPFYNYYGDSTRTNNGRLQIDCQPDIIVLYVSLLQTPLVAGRTYHYEFDLDLGDCTPDSVAVLPVLDSIIFVSNTTSGHVHVTYTVPEAEDGASQVTIAMVNSSSCTAYMDNFKLWYNEFDTSYQQCQMVARNERYRFGFGSHEKDNEMYGESNWYVFGDYGYDPRIVQRPRTEPLASKYPQLSPYVAFGNNPILFRDSDGRDVKAINDAAKTAILNTLTKEESAFVKFNSDGVIDKVTLSQSTSNSGNFQALKQLSVNDSRMYEVKVDNKIVSKNEKGELTEENMPEIEQGNPKNAGMYDPRTGETGWCGATQLPGSEPETRNSPDDKIKITINSGLSEEGQAETFAHEGYGHAYLYSKGEEHSHKFSGMTDTNQKLREQIPARIDETQKNYNENHKKTQK